MNKRIRKKHEKGLYNQELTRGGYFTSLKRKTRKIDKKWIAISLIIITIVGMIIFMKESYAYLYQTLRGEKSYSLKVKGFSLKLDDSSTSENIKIENSVPVSDSEGKNTNAYIFSIINEDTNDTGYVLYLDDVNIDNEINRMKDTDVKYQLIENGKETVGLVSDLGTNPFRILVSGVIGGNQTKNYSLRFWIKEDAEVPAGQVFNVKIRVIATSKEAIEEGKLVFGETVVTSDSGITSMTSDELQTYIDRALGNKMEQVKKETLDEAHPVGSVYTSINNEDPSEKFGGQWIRFGKGKTLVGVDEANEDLNIAEKTGGNKNGKIALTVAELPAHAHFYTATGTVTSTFTGTSVTTSTTGSHLHTAMIFVAGNDGVTIPASTMYITANGISTGWSWSSTPLSNQNEWYFPTNSAGEHSHTVTAKGTVASQFNGARASTENNGNSKAFSTQDPYVTVYMWKRVS